MENGHGLDPQPVPLVIWSISLTEISLFSASLAKKKPDIILDTFFLLYSTSELVINSEIDYSFQPPLQHLGPSDYALVSFIAVASQ